MKQFLIFCNLLFSLSFLSAQQREIKKETYPVYINYVDYSIRTDVLANRVNIKAKSYKTYFWYSSNKIMETNGGFDGKLLQGQYQAFYLDGNLKEKGQFKKGLKNGQWINWYENGKIKEITTWRDGVKNGKYASYDGTGQRILVSNYRNNLLNGITSVYRNDTISSEKKYKNGLEQPIEIKEEKKLKTDKERVDVNKKNSAQISLKNNNSNPEKKSSFAERMKNFFSKIKNRKTQKSSKKDNNKAISPAK